MISTNDSPYVITKNALKINIKVYDVSLSKQELNNTFCLIPSEGKRYDIETLSIDEVLNKEHFYGKIMHKTSTKS